MSDQASFIKLIKENEGLICKVAKVYTNSYQDEQDLYQDIVYQLWKSFDSFKGEAKITTWMYRVALNTAIAYLNKTKRTVYVALDEKLFNKPDITDYLKDERSELLFGQIKKLNTVEKE